MAVRMPTKGLSIVNLNRNWHSPERRAIRICLPATFFFVQTVAVKNFLDSVDNNSQQKYDVLHYDYTRLVPIEKNKHIYKFVDFIWL